MSIDEICKESDTGSIEAPVIIEECTHFPMNSFTASALGLLCPATLFDFFLNAGDDEARIHAATTQGTKASVVTTQYSRMALALGAVAVPTAFAITGHTLWGAAYLTYMIAGYGRGRYEAAQPFQVYHSRKP